MEFRRNELLDRDHMQVPAAFRSRLDHIWCIKKAAVYTLSAKETVHFKFLEFNWLSDSV